MGFIDLHCDTLMKAYLDKKDDLLTTDGMVDFNRMKQGGQDAQFFAMWMLSPDIKEHAPHAVVIPDEEYIEKLKDIFYLNLERHKDIISFAGNAADLAKNRKEGRMSAFLAIEDGRGASGSMDNLERYYAIGVRYITLTWNYANCFGWPNSEDPDMMAKGLTEYGRDAIARMGEMGMLVDVSHLSDGGFREVAELARAPFIASHSNCRSLCPHRRNLTDEMIKTIADKGGVVGVNFVPPFLGPDPQAKVGKLEMISAHIRHMIKVGGSEVAALGSDFDGISGEHEVPDSARMGLVFDRLAKDKVPSDVIENVAWRNAARVIADALK